MGPCEHPSTPPENQDTRPLKTGGCKRRARRPRSRVCLLEGCNRVYRPRHPLTRYCGGACREQARRWQEWKAGAATGHSAGCKEKRGSQSRRYRRRQKARNRKTQLASHARIIPIKFFFCAPPTAQDATSFSGEPGDLRCRVFALWPVVMFWSGFWNGRDAGRAEEDRKTEARTSGRQRPVQC